MNIEQEIRAQIEKNKGLKLAVGEINNHLSILEGLLRNERDDVQKQVNEAYQRGLDDAWEAAWKIMDMDDFAAMDAGLDTAPNLPVIEAIKKLKAYEEKQKADDEIKVGDEVKNERGWTAVVTWILDDRMALMGKGGAIADYHISDKFTKTGRHFDIDKILEAMKE